eukprot:scaffold82460_cov53-Phaeocystis_antarctica.AAC.1
MGDQGRVSPTHHATRLRLDCLDLHSSKPKGEPAIEHRTELIGTELIGPSPDSRVILGWPDSPGSPLARRAASRWSCVLQPLARRLFLRGSAAAAPPSPPSSPPRPYAPYRWLVQLRSPLGCSRRSILTNRRCPRAGDAVLAGWPAAAARPMAGGASPTLRQRAGRRHTRPCSHAGLPRVRQSVGRSAPPREA